MSLENQCLGVLSQGRLMFWRLMSRVNHEEESIITGKTTPARMIKSNVNSFLGGKF